MNQPQAENISLAAFLAWEQQQPDRYEWIDGMIVRCAGGSFEHATIISNLNAAFHAAVGTGPCFVQGSDRKLVPRDAEGDDLGSFYADLFVSCAPEDQRGDAAHFPTLVVEVLSPHGGAEFTRKKEAYLGSARLMEYLIIDSTRRYAIRYAWAPASAGNGRRLVAAEYRRGPVPMHALDLTITFDQIYAGTSVPAILHPIQPAGEEEAQVFLD
jgi:Uma2 family endonuclease